MSAQTPPPHVVDVYNRMVDSGVSEKHADTIVNFRYNHSNPYACHVVKINGYLTTVVVFPAGNEQRVMAVVTEDMTITSVEDTYIDGKPLKKDQN